MIREAMFYKKLGNKKLQCYLCNYHCHIAENKFGFCNVRQNIHGELYSHVYGQIIAQHIDPIEKKPLFHFLPGTDSYSIASPGCNFQCGFCQNYQFSQYKTSKEKGFTNIKQNKPEDIVKNAVKHSCKSISYTYTEPTIFFEFAYDTAKLAKQNKLSNVFVTNGYMTKEAIDKISPYLDSANIDLKSFRNDFYQNTCKAKLQPVLDTIKYMKEKEIWIEITTLIVPGQNDSSQELEDIARFISEIGKDIPWHISRFFPDYQFNDTYPTPIETIEKAKEYGKKFGLNYIHLGNI